MKIAIQGHPTRGKEVIQILEGLGGINSCNHSGSNPACYYEIHGNTIVCACTKSNSYKYYILDEFKKEFPLKVGDIILLKGLNKPCEILALEWYMDKLYYKLDNGLHYDPKTLTPYAEMKKERNITLTLDKAKEWYKKGGELREIALQAFTEKELNPLPRSWDEFCRKYEFACLSTRYSNFPLKYDALFKLEQLRNCWWNGWEPNWNDDQQDKHCIIHSQEFKIHILYETRRFLSFPTKEMAKEFLECFRDLIEKAGDLI
jgi:hypothetical protein